MYILRRAVWVSETKTKQKKLRLNEQQKLIIIVFVEFSITVWKNKIKQNWIWCRFGRFNIQIPRARTINGRYSQLKLSQAALTDYSNRHSCRYFLYNVIKQQKCEIGRKRDYHGATFSPIRLIRTGPMELKRK